MSQPQRDSSTDDSAYDNIRKRVCKACDRCRLKKSKCDGAAPCVRCKADNAICVFGEKKKPHDKVYPKGYVEMLEQQQEQLVSGLQEMYRRLIAAQCWSGPVLSETDGHPLTHDILAALDLLQKKKDGSNDFEKFEDDCEKLQMRLYSAGAPSVRRKASFSSDSEHSQRSNNFSTAQTTPNTSREALFKDDFTFSPSPPALAQTPPPRQRHSYPVTSQQAALQSSAHLTNDPQLYQPAWSMANLTDPGAVMRSGFAMQAPQLQRGFADEVPEMGYSDPWMDCSDRFDTTQHPFASNQLMSPLSGSLTDLGAEFDFRQWIQAST